MFARLAKRVHLFSKNPPRSSPLALAWELDHRAHPSLEDFLGKRTPRCIGPREPVETKSPRGRGGLFIDSQRRTSNGTRCALPNRSHPSTRLVTEDQGDGCSDISSSSRDPEWNGRQSRTFVAIQTIRGLIRKSKSARSPVDRSLFASLQLGRPRPVRRLAAEHLPRRADPRYPGLRGAQKGR
jgi:hypothetical protein